MLLYQIIVLALIQGVTEFLPISSSAHLILPKELLAWPDQGLAFDVAVHVGTLAAVVIYFWRDLIRLLIAWLQQFGGRRSQEAMLGWAVIVATIPAGIIGLLMEDIIEFYLRSMLVIAIATIVFGLLLWWADMHPTRNKTLTEMTIKDAILIGLAQAWALIPGTSRSGVTMTAGMFLQYSRTEAARFSFLLSIPLILAAGGKKTFDLVQQGDAAPWLDIGLGTLLSALSAFACIHLFLRILDKVGFLPFVIYRLVLGVFLLMVALTLQ